MIFEWDESKRAANLAKHGIDFAAAPAAWRSPMLEVGTREQDGERRHLALGTVTPDEMVVAIVYTYRDTVRRIISVRRARRNERTHYQSEFGRGR